MRLTNHDSKSYEKILSTFDLKFPRKYGAERLRKGFPSLRLIFDELQEQYGGNPPSPLLFALLIPYGNDVKVLMKAYERMLKREQGERTPLFAVKSTYT